MKMMTEKIKVEKFNNQRAKLVRMASMAKNLEESLFSIGVKETL